MWTEIMVKCSLQEHTSVEEKEILYTLFPRKLHYSLVSFTHCFTLMHSLGERQTHSIFKHWHRVCSFENKLM